ncbi:MAG TPA: 50S ribosomal protein L11 methyltransferase [Beijerinckiaceae bacterium]|jgi:ribosomal protein L11 methyltransferase|nr:50S ribosomal protein L11 methyltransferase [Beijerinckiaceae bacterium]
MLEGLPPNNAAFRMRLVCNEALARAVIDIVVETFDPGETAASAFEDKAPTTARGVCLWTVEIYFGKQTQESQIRALVASTAGEEAASAARFDRIGEPDWVKRALSGLPPVRVERFLIHGAHDRARARPNDIALEIEAALAFGTGHHGSTRGCLAMFAAVLKTRRATSVLDVGTGSGVLALAAAKVLRRKILAGDIDPIAVGAARANARLNEAAPWLFPIVAAGPGHPALRGGAPYDLIFANILAKPLRRLAPALARLAAPNAQIILSGLLAGDVAAVLSAYRAHGFVFLRRIDIEGWVTLLLCKPRRSQRTRVAAARRPV